MTDHMQDAVEAVRQEVWKMFVGSSTDALDNDKPAYAYDIEKVTQTAQRAIVAALPQMRAMIAEEIMATHDKIYNATIATHKYLPIVEDGILTGYRQAARVARGETYVADHTTEDLCHECSCHLTPLCYQCEHCAHWNVDDCPNDCQTCEVDHD